MASISLHLYSQELRNNPKQPVARRAKQATKIMGVTTMNNNYYVISNGNLVCTGTYSECQEYALYGCEQAQIFQIDENGNAVEIKDWI